MAGPVVEPGGGLAAVPHEDGGGVQLPESGGGAGRNMLLPSMYCKTTLNKFSFWIW